METIVVVLNSRIMENPDLDIRYALPELLEAYTQGELCDNGCYDYITSEELGIWLSTKSAKDSYQKVLTFLEEHLIYGNHLIETAKVYISDKASADLGDCTLVYDGCETLPDEATRVANRAKKSRTIVLKIAGLLTQDNPSIKETLAAKLEPLTDITAQWQCCVSLLTERNYLCYCNANFYLKDFLELFTETEGVKTNGLCVDETAFDEEDDLYNWYEALDEQWQEMGFCMAIFDAKDDDNDGNLIFPYKADLLEELSNLAMEINVQIVALEEY